LRDGADGAPRIREVREVQRAGKTTTLGALVALLVSASAVAAPSWQAPDTVATVRGMPDPAVAVDVDGTATVVYSTAPDSRGPRVFAAFRGQGGTFGQPLELGSGVEPQIVSLPSGAKATAWIDGDHIQVLRRPTKSVPQVRQAIQTGGTGATDLRLGVDGSGRVTLAWRPKTAGDYPSPVQLRATSIAPTGELGPLQALGAPVQCTDVILEVNLAGDAAAYCPRTAQIHIRAAGSALFQTEPLPLPTADYLTLDGAGTLTAVTPVFASLSYTLYKDRPRGGAFGPTRTFTTSGDSPVAAFIAQQSRTVAVWPTGNGVGYAIRPAGGSAFGEAGTIRGSGRGLAFADVAAPVGPLPLLAVAEPDGDRATLRLAGLGIGADGAGASSGRAYVPGAIDFPGNLAANEGGVAVATWEQRCGDGHAVMAMAFDEQLSLAEPPCQDRRAPKVIAPRRRARLAGRALTVRVACNESCRLTAKARVTQRGRKSPLAAARTARSRSIGVRRGASLRLRLSAGEARRVRRALRAGRELAVRLAVSAGDRYDNGRVWVLRLPLRR
jgi:hypothetical protein